MNSIYGCPMTDAEANLVHGLLSDMRIMNINPKLAYTAWLRALLIVQKENPQQFLRIPPVNLNSTTPPVA